MRARQRYALFFAAAAAAIIVGCTPPASGGGSTTTTTTDGGSSTTTAAPSSTTTTTAPSTTTTTAPSTTTTTAPTTTTTTATTTTTTTTTTAPTTTTSTTTTAKPTTTTTSTTTTSTTTTIPSGSTTRYVAKTGHDTGTCAVSTSPCLTITYAVSQAGSGNTIQVAAGTYAEVVTFATNLTFVGANSGIRAGVLAGTRGAETIVKGFRTAGNPGTTPYDVTIDGFKIDVQNDATLRAATAQAIVWLRGNNVIVKNNVFNGANTYVSNCDYTCTSMTDYAFTVAGGNVTFSDNTVTNFRRPVNINQPLDALPTHATVARNSFAHNTSRTITLAGSSGTQMPGASVVDNRVDGTGSTLPSATTGVNISNGGNTVTGNTFVGLSSGVYIDLCKKFITNSNQFTGNTFQSGVYGINVGVDPDPGQCTSSTVEGSGGWRVGAGRINGLVATDNNFTGNAAAAVLDGSYMWNYYSPGGQPISTGPMDATCNWWNAITGPLVAVHVYPEPLGAALDQLVYSAAPQAVWNSSPWLTAAAPGGACNGT